ncbi:MAG: S-layer homology domain-containing protein [Clostridiales bacterium]|nr:S-layer homology domain-containing protein [Clostridiales bacterium]
MRKTLLGIGVGLISFVMAVSPIQYSFANTGNVRADGWSKSQDNTGLGTAHIAAPDKPSDKNSKWSGSYVYYGKYNSDSVKFRVLSPDTTDYGARTMLLDSDALLSERIFNSDYSTWEKSALHTYLNGDFYNETFLAAEQDAIATSTIKGGKRYEFNSYLYNLYDSTVGLKGDKIFILDVSDVVNPEYGYISEPGYYNSTSDYVTIPNRDKIPLGYTNPMSWWLRAPVRGYSNISAVIACGSVDFAHPDNEYIYVAPAMNIDLEKVLFSSLVSGDSEYKLTLEDSGIKLANPSSGNIIIEGTTVTVPYEITGDRNANATRVSVLILDAEYEAGNPNNAKILYYDKLSGNFSTKGSGSFDLPSDLKVSDWGSKYHVYILAEDINREHETDFASSPVEIKASQLKNEEYTVTVTGDANITATASLSKGVKGTTVTLTAKAKDGYQFKTWQVVSGDVSLKDKTKATTTFTIGNKDVVIKAVSEKKAKPTATAKPTAKPTEASPVKLTLDKSSDNIICGRTDTLTATLKGSKAKISWKSSDTAVATVDAAGKVTAKMAGTVTITATAAGKTASCKVTVLYKDVTNDKDFWYLPTNYLTANGVVKGYDKQTKFKPANECTRAQMVTFIWRMEGEPEPDAKTCKFSDVKSSDYYYKACIWGNENHIVEGYKDGTFGPKIICARKHAVTFLWRLAGKPDPKSKTNRFTDVKAKDYYYTATLWTSEMKILAGYSDNTFRPEGNCLRRQMVTFLYKYDKYVNGKG